MHRPRIIPVLLLKNKGVVKSIGFKKYRYIGDPINAVKVFNDLHADELVFLDITASKEQRTISLDFIKNVGEEANMPFAVGGGINTLEQIRSIISAGAEKVIINTSAFKDSGFIGEAVESFGSSTITVCIDVKRSKSDRESVVIFGGKKTIKLTPENAALLCEEKGAGEIIIQSVDRDGTMKGYDLDLIKKITTIVKIPVVALGGAGTLNHLEEAYKIGNATGLAAGSLFVYHGPRNGILINYPTRNELLKISTNSG